MSPSSGELPTTPTAPASARLTAAWLRRGPLACLLLPMAGLYWAVTALRRTLYRIGACRQVRVGRPVWVVGNLVAGGAGKTPTTVALVQHLRAQGRLVGVVSRGYGGGIATNGHEVSAASLAADVGDEPLLIHRRTGVPVFIGSDRAASALSLIARHPEVELILCDDGLQHWRLARDLEIVVFDERGTGNGWLLPAGPLREAVGAPSFAPARLVLYNAPAATTHLPGALARRRLAGACRLEDWWAGRPAEPWPNLPPGPWWAVAGIAVPQRFFDQLSAIGLPVQTLPLPDHHDYGTLPWPADARHVILTEKDAVKLEPERIRRDAPGVEIWVATLDFEPEASFWHQLDARLRELPSRSPATSPPHG